MSNHDYLKTSDSTFRLRADVLTLMLKGASYAAIFCLVCWVLIGGTIWLGSLLPPESKEAPDPNVFYMQPAEPTALA